MKTRRKRWIVIAVLVALILAVLVPGSPVHLSSWWSENEHAGRSKKSWVQDLGHADPAVRLAAIVEVGKIGPEAGDAVPELAKLLQSKDDVDARVQASLALTKMAPASRGAVPALIAALKDPDPLVRNNAAYALRRLGGDARPALPALLVALEDAANHTNARTFSHTIHHSIVRAVGTVGEGLPDGVPALTTCLAPAQPAQTKLAALASLREIGAPSKSAAPAIRLLLKDPDEETRTIAAETIAALGLSATGETAEAPENFELPEDERRYLWKIENAGNHLVKSGFEPLAKAIKTGDRPAILAALALDFTGSEPADPKVVRTESSAFLVERSEESGRPGRAISREQFADKLLALRAHFPTAAPGVKLNLMTLSPRTFGDLESKTWLGAVQIRMQGDGEPGAPVEIVAVARYEIVKPTRELLAQPGWWRRAEIAQVQIARARKPLFVDATAARGLKPETLHDNWTAEKFIPTTGGAYVTDYDRDGWLDLLITDPLGLKLLRGSPDGRFEDVTVRVGLLSPDQDSTAAWVDLDGDGWDDLIANRRIYRNDGGRRFIDFSNRCNIRPPDRFANILVADYDRDGKLDLYFARTGPPGSNSWLDHRSSDPNGNYLFRNLGDFQFEDVTRRTGTAAGRRSTFTAAWLDANNDGWPDLFVPNEFGDGVLLVNDQKGAFREVALADKPADFGTMGLAVGDLDNDGNVDIYCNNMYSKAGTRVIGNMNPKTYPPAVMERLRRFVAGSQLHLNRGNLKFDQVGPEKKVAAVGWAYGAALADFDNDGWLDIHATAGYVSRDRNEPDG